MIDAFIMNGPTLRIIRNIQSRLESSPGIINGWPCRYPACQIFNAGTMQSRQLLGSPAGKWISELLLSFVNPHRLGRKLITGVAVWTPMQGLGCDQPALVLGDPRLDRAIGSDDIQGHAKRCGIA